jgi:RNA polymerase sigma-70 factor (ECF subfamily)
VSPKNYSSQSDRELVAEVNGGDQEAYGELVLRYQDRIYNLCRKYVYDQDAALDIAQTAFIRAYRALGTFRQDARFSTWLYRIAVNEAISYTRKRKVRSAVSIDQEEGAIPVSGNTRAPEAGLEQRETQRMVQRAIAELPEEYRIVILLRDIEDRSYDEIAEMMNVPLGTVRSRIHRARQDLREKLKDKVGTLAGAQASNE